MATLLWTFNGEAIYGPSNKYSVQAKALLYLDTDTGSGYTMHWVWQLFVPKWVRDVGWTLYMTTPIGSVSGKITYSSGSTMTNTVLASKTGPQFTVAYGGSCSTTTTSYWTSDGGNKYQSSLSASQTTYTVPKPTYSVNYNANGGTGAPGGQTKTYGTNLTLSSTRPTRTDYDFVGWGTSSVASSASYQPGSTYSANSSITLYAIWKLNYIKPSIQGIVVDRCDSSGNLMDDGTYVRVYFGYAADTTFDSTNKISTVSAKVNGVTKTETVNAQSGNVTLLVNAGVNESTAYIVTVTVTDTYKNGTTTASVSLSIPAYAIDFSPSNKAIGIGIPADMENYVHSALNIAVNGGILVDGMAGSPWLNLKNRKMSTSSNPSNEQYTAIRHTDANGNTLGYWQTMEETNGIIQGSIEAQRGSVHHGLFMRIASNGSRSVIFTQRAPWLTGLNIHSSNNDAFGLWVGSSVVNVGTTAVSTFTLFTKAQLQAIVGTNWTPSGSNCSVFVMNGDYGATDALMTSSINSSSIVRVHMNKTRTGNIRVNWMIVRFAS